MKNIQIRTGQEGFEVVNGRHRLAAMLRVSEMALVTDEEGHLFCISRAEDGTLRAVLAESDPAGFAEVSEDEAKAIIENANIKIAFNPDANADAQ